MLFVMSHRNNTYQKRSTTLGAKISIVPLSVVQCRHKFKGHVICHHSEIIYKLISSIYPCGFFNLLVHPQYVPGDQGGHFFHTCLFYALLPLEFFMLLCDGHFSSCILTTKSNTPNIILRFSFGMTQCVLHHHRPSAITPPVLPSLLILFNPSLHPSYQSAPPAPWILMSPLQRQFILLGQTVT